MMCVPVVTSLVGVCSVQPFPSAAASTSMEWRPWVEMDEITQLLLASGLS
jgi:hypothetical protein